jgi:ABC-type antimicrobial peptide transport system permease subunit
VVGAFAATGTLLAAVGIFGPMSYVVRQRRREIGVRMAVGATPGSLIWLVVERGMRYVLLACLLPGIRAARIRPVEALSSD